MGAQAPPSGPAKRVSFINEVAPILKENCFACHDAKKRKGKLDMTTYEGLRKGGTKDDPIVPGKPEDSLICDLLTAMDKSRMPPREAGDALAKEKIDVISRWIKEGASLDAGIQAKADLLRELRVRWKPPLPPATYPYPAAITALVFTPDNRSLVTSGHHELLVWDIARGTLVERVYTRADRTYGLAFLPDGKLAVAGGRPGQQGDVRIYDLQRPGPHKGNAPDDPRRGDGQAGHGCRAGGDGRRHFVSCYECGRQEARCRRLRSSGASVGPERAATGSAIGTDH